MSKDTLYWAENAAGRIYFSDPRAVLQPGYMLKSTTNVREMDRLFQKMHDQERAHNEQMLERLYNQSRPYYEAKKKALIAKLASGSVSDAEKMIIRECLKLMDQRDSERQENHVYGVSAMQEAPEPLPARNTRVM